MKGSLYNKAFKQNIKALDDALESLKSRYNKLRDGAIVETRKVGTNTFKVVSEVAATTATIDDTTRETHEQVQDLQNETQVLLSIAEGTDSRVIQVSTEVKALGDTQTAFNTKMDDMRDTQHATHAAVSEMTDVQKAIHQAKEAHELATKNAECVYQSRYFFFFETLTS